MSTYDTGLHHYEDDEETGYDSTVAHQEPTRPVAAWHGGADLGLLALRLMLGGLVGVHGAQRVFGLFGGHGLGDFTKSLQQAGFKYTDILAPALGYAELGGAVLLVLGLFTPLAAAAVLVVVGNTIILQWNGGLSAYELAASLSGAAFAVLFAGPGRISLDRPTPWYRHALGYGTSLFSLAVIAVAALQLLLR
ncbi:DoxX family protein [Kutzneria sp. CA-103260]|uniref:DoxX family protein n=1 Tax=Kutzneria sp. CA-103260 TaxID=2802641 RepID=UPI001BAD0CC3|nr:DoxX family protein [Kutzneria sp. CA-103260]QUQ71388.1 DoxX [Kutzneria sp. CA-103260]